MLSVERREQIGASVILYDGSRLNHMHEEWFDPEHWPGAAQPPAVSGGRGATLFIEHGAERWVLRHYHRGGTVARVVRDAYLWLGEARVRSFAEWRLLARLKARGLPVPAPVAARYVRDGLVYRADLITVRIPGVTSLAAAVAGGRLADETWWRVGACIGRFHAAGVYHADLNAHNVQLTGPGEVHLIDFDRGRILPAGGPWQGRNLARLHRSLLKVTAKGSRGFSTGQWNRLLEGYRSRAPASAHGLGPQ